MNWVPTKLGDLVNITHGFAFEGEYFRDEPPGDILLTPGNFAVGGGFKDDKFKYYIGPVPEEFVLEEGDLLVTMTDLSKAADTLGYPALIPASRGFRFLHNQRLGKVLFRPSAPIRKDFLYYVLRSRPYRNEVLASATGTTVKHTSPERIRAFKFMLPPLDEQRAIAHILGSLDDKIELNRQMNETLEAMARAIFKSWFVDFDPVRAKAEGCQPFGMDGETAALFPDSFQDSPLGKIPKGWGVTSLREEIEASRGLSYTGKGLAEAGFPLHNLNSVLEGGGYKYEGIKHYIGEYDERHIVKPGDLIVTNTEQGFDFLLIGYPAIVPKCCGDVGLFSHHLFRVRPRLSSPIKLHFLYWLLMSPVVRPQIIGCTNGTTVNMLAPDGLERPRIALPPAQLIDAFERFATPVQLRTERNHEESMILAHLRDALLRKLISGEIRLGAKVRDPAGLREGQ